MTTSIVDAESVLVLDIGSVQTRSLLFDTVDGQYRFIAAGVAPSTPGAPYFDVGEGVHQSLLKLQSITARTFLNRDSQLMLPANPDGSGVDQLMVIFSAGPELQFVTMGLLEDVSLESATHLAQTTFGRIVEEIGLNDRRRPEAQIDAILATRPDLIIFAGGTDKGATRSIGKLVELILFYLQCLPEDSRPEILYAGNSALANRIKEILTRLTRLHPAPNIRPGIDQEDLGPAADVLAQVVGKIRTRQIGGLESLGKAASVPPIPTSHGLGRMIAFLSKVYDRRKGVLGVDLGSSHTTVAAGISGELSLNTFPIGSGAGAPEILKDAPVEDVVRWLPVHIPDDVVLDYLHQKSLYPAMVPVTAETLAIEQAIARQALFTAMTRMLKIHPDLVMGFEPILVSGTTLTQYSTPGQSLLALLDGLQPMGVTTLLLDTNGLLPALGAIAPQIAELPVQVLESSAFVNLGTAICVSSDARFGTPLMNVKLDYGGNQTQLEIRQGTITSLPVRPGQTMNVHISPLRRLSIDPTHRDRSRSFKIVGGVCGAVIDARSRPLGLPKDAARRRDLLKKWALAVNA